MLICGSFCCAVDGQAHAGICPNKGIQYFLALGYICSIHYSRVIAIYGRQRVWQDLHVHAAAFVKLHVPRNREMSILSL